MINDTKIISHAVWTHDTRILRNTCRGGSISRSLLDLHKTFGADGLIATAGKVDVGRIILHARRIREVFFSVCVYDFTLTKKQIGHSIESLYRMEESLFSFFDRYIL